MGDILEEFRNALEKLESEVRELRLKADASTGKIMPVENLSGTFNAIRHINDYARNTNRYSYTEPSLSEKAAAMKRHIEELYAAARSKHEANIPAMENNRVVAERVSLIMQNIGMPSQYSKRIWSGGRVRGKYVWETREAGWHEDVRMNLPTSDGFSGLDSQYKAQIRSVDEILEKAKREEEAKERDRQKELAAQEAEKVRAVLVVKYGLDYASGYDALLDAVLEKNKYLRLAHFLQENRNDWNEGYSYAEAGLNGFSVETEQDQQIYDDIHGCIENWDGDGRVFRDTDWNYSVLFGLVPDELLSDYQLIYRAIER